MICMHKWCKWIYVKFKNRKYKYCLKCNKKIEKKIKWLASVAE